MFSSANVTSDMQQAWIAERLAQNRASLERMRRHLGQASGDPFGRPPCDFRVAPALVRPGEPVQVTVTARVVIPPDGA
jgi:hypothetical protein